MADYFADGGTLTLEDGTVIGDVNELAGQDSVIGQLTLGNDILSKILSKLGQLWKAITTAITDLLTNIWNAIQTLGITITDFLSNFWTNIQDLGLQLVETLVLELKNFFILPNGFFIDYFYSLTAQFGPQYENYVDSLRTTFYSAGDLSDLYANVTVGGVTTHAKVVDFDGLRNFLPTVRNWFAGLIYFTCMV